MSKLTLGTVQFGLKYGINNDLGKVAKEEVFSILDYAKEKGISTLDTAYAYGESENVLGNYLKSNKGFNVISKFPKEKNKNVYDIFNESLKRLNINSLYAYMYHSFDTFTSYEESINDFYKLKKEGYVKKIGFSLYSPKEALCLFDKGIEFDIVQFPYSIFDRRFEKIMPLLKEKGVEIHVRSVFLQGLVFKNAHALSKHFNTIKKPLLKLNALSEENDISVSAFSLNFALLNKMIDSVVIGVDSLSILKDNIENTKQKDICENIMNELLKLKVDDENVILPTNWEKG